MRAIVQDRYGTTDVLRLAEVDKPAAGDGQVLVRVHAAGVDPGVWHLMTGLPYLVRLMGYGVRRPRTRVRGMDLAGVVEAVGAGVTRFEPGDRVFGWCDGSFAEYVSAPRDNLLPMPAGMTFTQAAAVPISGLTALHGVRDAGGVRAGQRVLVIGAAGGVGTFAVQIAKAFGAEVTGVCSTTKVDLVRSLGADHVIDYTGQDITRGGRRFDVILDIAGNRPLSHLRRALSPAGTLVLIGGEDGGRWLGVVSRIARALLLSPLVRQRLRPLVSKERAEDLAELKDLIEAGAVTPVIGATYPLHRTSEAVDHVAGGHARGKTVITV